MVVSNDKISMPIYLNDLTAADSKELYAIIRNPDFFYPYINQNKGTDPDKLFAAAADYTCLAENARQQQPRQHWFKAIRAQQDDRLLGCVVLINPRETAVGQNAEIGFFVAAAYQNQKIGRTAAINLVDWAWQNVGLRAMHATVDPQNTSSIQLLHRLGLEQSGFIDAARGLYHDRNGNKRPRILMAGTTHTISRALLRQPQIPEISVL